LAIVGGGEVGKNLVALPWLPGYFRASIRGIFGISFGLGKKINQNV